MSRPKRAGLAGDLLLFSLLASLSLPGCPSSKPKALLLVTARDVEPADDPPSALEVRDVGSPDLTGKRRFDPNAGHDGAGAIGELLLVSGEDFGRRPRVTIDGRTAAQVARTERGVIVRVPWGVRTGSRRVEVRNARGQAATTFPLRRYVLATVPSKDAIYVFELNRSFGLQFFGAPLSLPGARLLRYSADGRTAYVSGRDAKGALLVATVDMVHRGGPKLGRTFAVPGARHVALAAAASAPLAVAISDTHAAFIDTRDPTRRVLYKPVPLPKELLEERIVAADMDPRGTLLALLLARKNEVRLFDVTEAGTLRPLARTRVLPKDRAPLVRDLRFSADAKNLWVISGDNAKSLRYGRYPLRLTVIKIQQQRDARSRSFGVLSVWRSLDVPHRAAPVGLAVARGQPLASGRTVEVPPQNAAVFITVRDTKLLGLRKTRFDRRRGLRRAARILRGLSPLGTVVRTNIQGAGGPMFASDSLLGALDITSDSQLLLVAGAKVEVKRRPARVTLVYGISTCPVFGKAAQRFVPLAAVYPESLARPFLLGTVRAQP